MSRQRLFPDSVYNLRKGETEDQRETRLWKPVRIMSYYCSPRCGFRCTWDAYTTAVKLGDELARRMGPGWEPRVWENYGWHYDVRCGTAVVTTHCYHVGEAVSYTVWLNSEAEVKTSGNIRPTIQTIMHVPGDDIEGTLQKALDAQLQVALQLLDEAQLVVKGTK